MTTKLLLPLSALVLSLLIRTVASQETNGLVFWEEWYRLNFTYDFEGPGGTDSWDQVDTVSSEGEWGWYDSRHPIFDLDINLNECSENVRPSPINLFQDVLCQDTHEIRTRQKQDGDCTRDDIAFVLTPYGVKAYYPWYDDNCQRPTIQMDGFEDFILVWLELHARSEHVIDGRRFDAELQFVHMGTGNNNSEIATVSVLIDASARQDNEEFQWLLNQWNSALTNQTERCASTTPSRTRFRKRNLGLSKSQTRENTNPTVAISSSSTTRRTQDCKPDRFGQGCEPLLPRDRMYPYSLWPTIWYFSYHGSITSPPCSAIVHWRILDTPMLISRRQYKQLASLLKAFKNKACDDDMSLTSTKGENSRPLQVINSTNQPVAHCGFKDFSFDVFSEGEV